MSRSEVAIQALKGLPENAGWDDILETMLFMADVEQGLQDSQEGRFVSNDAAKKLFEQWTKK